MGFGSSEAASIAASQAAAAGQQQAAQNALNFAQDVFSFEKGQRAPFVDAGTSAVTGAMQLLGLGPNGIRFPGSASSGAHAGSSGPGSIAGSRGTGSTSGLKNLADYVPPGNQLANYVPPGNNFADYVPPAAGATPTSGSGAPPAGGNNLADYVAMSASSAPAGTQATSPTSAVLVTDQSGNQRWAPASLAPFYQARGFTIG